MAARKRNSLVQFLGYALRHSILFISVLLILSIAYVFSNFKSADYFPIQTVKIVGLQHLDKDEMRQTLLPLVNRGFFAINVEYIRDRLQQMPWVSDLSVRRQWPSAVNIIITEKMAAARWNNASLLSSEGQLFIPKDMPVLKGLPEFVGPDGQQITMLKYFVNINRILSPLHVKISYLELTPYFTWKLKLDNGMALKVGHNDILTRLTHFVKVYPKIVGDRAVDVEYIDLRYPNGMAVKWKNAG